MNYDSFEQLSKYREIAPINKEHGVYLADCTDNSGMFVKKVMTVYNRRVFDLLKAARVPGTPEIFCICEANGTLTVIEEYIEGQTLEGFADAMRLREPSGLTPSAAAAIIIKIAQVVKRLHALNPPVIHRDIKPSNVILTEDGRAFLIDFNAAKFVSGSKSEDTVLLGTHGYAAPEQYGFGESGEKTDIYALGVLLRELLAGPDAKDASLCGDYAPIVEKATRLDPSGRYDSADEFIKEVERVYAAAEPHEVISRGSGSFLPPGFRSGNKRNMVLGTLGYAFIFFEGVTFLCPSNSLTDIISTKVFFTLICLTVVACLFNYRGIWDWMPLTRDSNMIVKAIGVILLTVISLLLLFFATILVVMALGGL